METTNHASVVLKLADFIDGHLTDDDAEFIYKIAHKRKLRIGANNGPKTWVDDIPASWQIKLDYKKQVNLKGLLRKQLDGHQIEVLGKQILQRSRTPSVETIRENIPTLSTYTAGRIYDAISDLVKKFYIKRSEEEKSKAQTQL